MADLENEEKLINRDTLNRYTGGAATDAEFIEALEGSFENFIHNYRLFLLARDMERLRRTGHNIKPTAKMMEVDILLEEYDHGKSLIRKDASIDKLRESGKRMQKIVDRILDEIDNFSE